MPVHIALSEEVEAQLERFSCQLKQGKVGPHQSGAGTSRTAAQRSPDIFLGSYDIALTTAQILRYVISNTRWGTARDVLELVQEVGKRLISAQPSESTVANIIKRVLKLIREEAAGGEEDETVLEQKMLVKEDEGLTQDQCQVTSGEMKTPLIEAVNELIMEIETSADNIAMQALEHIHSNEIIMTAGRSRTVEKFLKQAASKKRKFQVIVAECAPFYHGQELGRSLAEAGVETTIITDSAVFAMMARVNKCIIGTHTVLANGGLKALCGCHTMALAARHYSTPLIVLAPMFKLTPQYLCSHDQDGFNKFTSPQPVLNFSQGELLSKVHVYNPVFDYVPPELVTLFISNIGGNAPSYVYRLLSELYHPQDHSIT